MTKNEESWNKIFNKYNILKQIETEGHYIIQATEIKEFREPRLMTKFDHEFNLPSIFKDNELAILPITRGSYMIAPFLLFKKFEEISDIVNPITIPDYLQSLQPENIVNEAMALDCAYSCGILSDFLEDENLLPTVSGRMGSGKFDFTVNTTHGQKLISVDNSQIEIDASYEGINYLSLFEAKNDIYDDFLIRQLYYPFRAWKNKICKEIKSIFLIYSNGNFNLYQYHFSDPNNYNSIELIKQANYQISASIYLSDIQNILKSTPIEEEPEIPFPQANSMLRIINLIESLEKKNLSKNSITEKYAFDERQTTYYTDAGRYLGLIEKHKESNREIFFSLSPLGKRITSLSYRNKLLELVKQILKHKVFREVLTMHLEYGEMPDLQTIKRVMAECHLFKIEAESTFKRRSSTITGWVNWILTITDKS